MTETIEGAAIQNVLAAMGGLDAASSLAMKRRFNRIVSILTRMAMISNGVAESQAEYIASDDYEHERRFAEHESEGKPEQRH